MSGSIYGDAGRDAEGNPTKHRVPVPKARRGKVGRVRLRDTPWGRQLIEHENRKREQEDRDE